MDMGITSLIYYVITVNVIKYIKSILHTSESNLFLKYGMFMTSDIKGKFISLFEPEYRTAHFFSR